MLRPTPPALRILPWIATAAVAPAFAAAIASAASWPIAHDFPLMLYAGFLMHDQGLVPYRDFFDMNPPGTLYFNRAYYAAFGADPSAFRVVHMTWLAAVLAGMVAFARRWGLAAAFAAAMCFAVAYTGTGRDSAFQREFLLTLPLIGSLLLAFPIGAALRARGAALRAFAIGLLFGAAASVKPPAAIGLPLLMFGFVLAHAEGESWSRLWGRSVFVWAGWTVLGFALVPALLAGLLAAQGALGPFVELASGYWPLYRQVAGDGRVLVDGMPAFAVAQTLERISEFPHLLAAIVGMGALATRRALRDRETAAVAAVLLLWTGAWAFYVYYGGKTWYYHAHPLYLVLGLLAGLAVFWLDPRGPIAAPRYRVLAAVPLLALFALPAARESKPLDLASVEEVAGILAERLEPGDRVLPVDVTRGALHAMLLVRAPLAGSFQYSFHFLHHADTSYIQGLRAQQLAEMRALRPRFVLRAVSGWQIQGDAGPARFEQLDRLLARHYRPLPLRNRGQLELLERVGPSGPR
jgi:hypothetical protein